MRTLTTLESALLDAAQYRVATRVRVKNGSGTLIDLSNHRGVNWIELVRYEEDIDELVSQAVIELKRDVIRPGGGADSVLSLAPLRTDSYLNRLDDGLTYSPLLDVGREIHVDVATTESWRAPVTADWKPLLKGTINSIDSGRDPLIVEALDEGAALNDRWIEAEKQYGSGAGVAMETVMQTILDDVFGASVVLLYTPTSPSFLIKTYTQRTEPVLDALRTLADLIGWDVRYRWHAGTSSFRLTLQQPPRTKSTPDRTFGPSRILDVRRLMINRQEIRNAVTVIYGPAIGTTPRAAEVRTDATSISKYGRRWMGIEESTDSSIDTSAEAGTLADAALADLKDPKAEQEIDTPFFWPAETWDLIRFSANAIHYNTDQDLAVSMVRHEIAPDRHRTTLQVRGKPAGHYLLWYVKASGPPKIGGTVDYPERRGASRVRDTVDLDRRIQIDLASSVKQQNAGSTPRRLTKGHLAGTGKNGDPVSFPTNFDAPPKIEVVGGITYEPRSAQWSAGFNSALPQIEERLGVDVTVSGFTLRGRLTQKGGSTPRSHNFPASNNLTAAGHTTELVLANAPSNNDQYTVHCSVSLTVSCTATSPPDVETFGELVIAVDTRIDGGPWVEAAGSRRTYFESDVAGGGSTTLTVAHEQIAITVSGLDNTDEVRLRIVSLTKTGAAGVVTCSVHGFDGTGDPDSGVTYTTATDSYATMTPDAQDFLSWRASEVDS